MKLRIVSPDGTGFGTRIETDDGKLVTNVTDIKISISAEGGVKAELVLEYQPFDVVVPEGQVHATVRDFEAE